ncbi:switch-associated protein 70-like [Littorina saxatilis]|uniref:PH domain-containing protein n=1 Tax=Littorina saxatilis TaxID=31220 RepID=A0AAN9AIN3_9CAEN
MPSLEDTRRSIWHAFTALARGEDGQVAKSRLKVLTNSIGRALGSQKAEEILEDGEEDNLSFSKYFSIISPKLLQPEEKESPLTPTVCTEIDKICWMLCEAHYHKNSKLFQHASSLNGDDLCKLWKVFNFLAKVDLDGTEDSLNTATLPLRVDIEEAHRIASLIRQAVGYSPVGVPLINPSEDDDDEGDKFAVDFVEFIVIMCTVVMEQGLTSDVMRQGINSVKEEILNDIIKKGYLEKFGNQVTNWKRRWFRLSAKECQYFTSNLEKEMKGTIEVCANFKPESVQNRSGKQFKIKLRASNRTYELAASDLRTRNEWVTALQKAADYCGQQGSYQKCELMEREKARKARRDKLSDELDGKSAMRAQLKNRDKQLEHEMEERMKDKTLLEMREQELEAERLARLGVEARLAEEEAALEAERLRLKELEEIRAILERLLEEERQAKRDEEIVRNLQARILMEETEKREQLEMLRNEQERLFQQEREEREGLERRAEETMALLSRTQHQLNLLAQERQQADQQIKEAEEKMRLAEEERQKMQERLRLREMSTSVGLRQPKPTPNPNPFVTHRGRGAFTAADFARKNLENSAGLDDTNGHNTTDAAETDSVNPIAGAFMEADFSRKNLENSAGLDDTNGHNTACAADTDSVKNNFENQEGSEDNATSRQDIPLQQAVEQED